MDVTIRLGKSMTSDTTETYSPAYIGKILRENKVIASVGVSLNPAKPSYLVGRWLSLRGYRIIPVNPAYAGKDMWGHVTHGAICEIKEPIDMLQIFRRSEAVPAIIDEALDHLPKLKTIWMQIGVTHSQAAQKAREQGIEVVQNLCPKMEHQRLSGELGRFGVNTGLITSKLINLGL